MKGILALKGINGRKFTPIIMILYTGNVERKDMKKSNVFFKYFKLFTVKNKRINEKMIWKKIWQNYSTIETLRMKAEKKKKERIEKNNLIYKTKKEKIS